MTSCNGASDVDFWQLDFSSVQKYMTFYVPSGHWNKIWTSRILLQQLFWPSIRRNYSSDKEFFLKFEAEGEEFAKNFRSLEQFVQAVKIITIFGNRMLL